MVSYSYSKQALTHGNIVQTVKVGQGLCVSFVLNQLLRASVQKTDVLRKKVNAYTMNRVGKATHWVGSEDLLAIKF